MTNRPLVDELGVWGYRDDDVLDELINGRGMKPDEIADGFGVNACTVRHHIRNSETVEPRKVGGSSSWDKDDTPWREPEKLQSALDETGSIYGAAEKLGCNQSTITRWIERLDDVEYTTQYERRKQNHTPREDIMVEIERFHDTHGKAPKLDEMKAMGITEHNIREECGNFTTALADLGLKPRDHYQRKPSREELKAELRRHVREHGRLPSYHDVSDVTKYTQYLYKDEFGSWSNAKASISVSEVDVNASTSTV